MLLRKVLPFLDSFNINHLNERVLGVHLRIVGLGSVK